MHLLPVERIVELAHPPGAKVLIDGCQAVPRMPVDVRALGCDFYVFSGHKAYGPTGIGVLYGRYDVLEAMPPWQTGGGMILNVEFDHTEFQEPPHRFEAGTPDIAGAVGLGLAIDFIEGLGRDAIREHEEALTGYAIDRLSRDSRACICCRPGSGGSACCPSMSMGCIRTMSARCSTSIDVAVRVGHHCAQPLMDKLGLAGTVRASLGVYNDERDIDRWPRRSRRRGRCSGDDMDLRELYQDIILDHGRHPRNFHALEHPTHLAQGPQPAVRRPGDGLPRGRRRPHRRCQLRGARLRDLDRGGLADDRGAEGQDDRRGEGALFAQFRAKVTGGEPPSELPEPLEEDANGSSR